MLLVFVSKLCSEARCMHRLIASRALITDLLTWFVKLAKEMIRYMPQESENKVQPTEKQNSIFSALNDIERDKNILIQDYKDENIPIVLY